MAHNQSHQSEIQAEVKTQADKLITDMPKMLIRLTGFKTKRNEKMQAERIRNK